METKLPPLHRLPNGVLVPTEEFIIQIHDQIIEYRRQLGRNDPPSIRDRGIIAHACDTLTDRPHKYKKNVLENALYVATEAFYYIACQHPFTEGNKSTAYIVSLVMLYTNMISNKEGGELDLKLERDGESFITAPEEAGEITRLAEAGNDEAALKRLIKGFLQREIGVKR